MSQDGNYGTVYKAEDKKSEKSPDYWGYQTVDGVDYKFAAWIKKDKKGRPCLSTSLTLKGDTGRRGEFDSYRKDNREPDSDIGF